MARDPTELSIVQIEKRLLGAMCQAAGGGSVWALAEGALQNKGFPDLVWQDFFEPCTLSNEEARRLVQRLLDSEQRA